MAAPMALDPEKYETAKAVPITQEQIERALQVFGLTAPVTPDRLTQRYRELLVTWHPHRYANLTNNPRKYMQMYKKGEAMSKEVHAAYKMLLRWVQETDLSQNPEGHS